MGPRCPMLAPSDILFLGSGNIPRAERETIEQRQIEMVSLGEVKRDPAAAGDRAAAWAARFDQIVLHVDVDVLAYTSFPIAENVRREPGLELSELAVLLEHLLPIPNWCAMTITEANPDHAPVAAEIFSRFIGMLARAFAAAA
jgi:arginase